MQDITIDKRCINVHGDIKRFQIAIQYSRAAHISESPWMAGDVRYKVVKQIDPFDGSTLMIGGDRDAMSAVNAKLWPFGTMGDTLHPAVRRPHPSLGLESGLICQDKKLQRYQNNREIEHINLSK